MSQIKIEIKVDETTTYTILEEDNLIQGLSIIRKMDSDITALNSDIECGEVNVQLSNLFNEFNPILSTAPYSQIKNGQEVKIYSITELGTYTLFTGYIVDFVAPTSTNTQSCNFRVVDRLHSLLNADISTNTEIQIETNINLFDFISILFSSYDVLPDEVEIDEDLKQIILDYSILNGKTLAEQLNEICKAVDAYIYVNRVGRIIIKTKDITGVAVKTFTREDNDNYLKTTEYGYSLFSSYNKLKVGYVSTKKSDTKNILNIDNQVLQAGLNEINNFDLGVSNLYELDSVKLTSSSDSIVEEVAATSSTISIKIYNPSQDEDIVSIEVYGKTIESASAFIVKSVETEEIEHSLEVSSVLVQNKAYADGLAEKLYNRVLEPIPYIKADVEIQDFAVDLSYIIRILDTESDLDYTGYIHSIDIEYDGQGYAYYKLGIKALYKESEENE